MYESNRLEKQLGCMQCVLFIVVTKDETCQEKSKY